MHVHMSEGIHYTLSETGMLPYFHLHQAARDRVFITENQQSLSYYTYVYALAHENVTVGKT